MRNGSLLCGFHETLLKSTNVSTKLLVHNTKFVSPFPFFYVCVCHC
jgi:hypothetical protein